MFLWKNKKPRIRFDKLKICRKEGGLGVPDIYAYYLAFNGKYPMCWAYYYGQREVGSLLWLEQKIVHEYKKETSLSSLWYCTDVKTNIKDPIISFSCKIAKIIQKKCSINGLMLPSCPLWENPLLLAGGKTLNNETWKKYNIRNLGQIVKQNKIISFSEFKNIFALNDTVFLQYLQIKSILMEYLTKGILLASDMETDNKLKEIIKNQGTVSKLYRLIHPSPCNTLNKIKAQWEQDLGKNLTAEQWGTIMRRTNYLSKCIRYKLIQMKILHRAYITPQRLHKMNPDTPELCWHCGERGSLIHLLWQCPQIKQFWAGVQNILCTILRVNVSICPEVCLLGLKLDGIESKALQHLLSLAFLSVKRIILMNWKIRKLNCFCLDQWLKDFIDLIMMEQAAIPLLESYRDKGLNILWSSVREYVEERH